jgi:hypothetical protein
MLTPTFTGPAIAWISRVDDGLGMPKNPVSKARIPRFLLDGGRSALCVGSANKTTTLPGNARAATSCLFDARPFHVHPPTTCMILHRLGSLCLICAPWGPPGSPKSRRVGWTGRIQSSRHEARTTTPRHAVIVALSTSSTILPNLFYTHDPAYTSKMHHRNAYVSRGHVRDMGER